MVNYSITFSFFLTLLWALGKHTTTLHSFSSAKNLSSYPSLSSSQKFINIYSFLPNYLISVLNSPINGHENPLPRTPSTTSFILSSLTSPPPRNHLSNAKIFSHKFARKCDPNKPLKGNPIILSLLCFRSHPNTTIVCRRLAWHQESRRSLARHSPATRSSSELHPSSRVSPLSRRSSSRVIVSRNTTDDHPHTARDRRCFSLPSLLVAVVRRSRPLASIIVAPALSSRGNDQFVLNFWFPKFII